MASIFKVFCRNRMRSLFTPSTFFRFLAVSASVLVFYLCVCALKAPAGHSVKPSLGTVTTQLSAGSVEREIKKDLRIPPHIQQAVALDLDQKHDIVRTANESASGEEVLGSVLLLYDTWSWYTAKEAKRFLEAQRIPFDIHRREPDSTPPLTIVRDGKEYGRYSLIIVCGSLSAAAWWGADERQSYLEYCRQYGVAVVSLASVLKDDVEIKSSESFSDLTTFLLSPQSVQSVSLNLSYSFYYVKPGKNIAAYVQGEDKWTVYIPKQNGKNVYRDRDTNQSQTLKEQQRVSLDKTANGGELKQLSTLATVTYTTGTTSGRNSAAFAIEGTGLHDGVRKVFLGSPVTYWLTKLLLLDVIKSFSRKPVLTFGRERWVMVDIDDIFVAPEGTKMVAADVQALLDTQKYFRSLIPGFTFNLGFCAYYYDRGLPQEIEGNRCLVGNASSFWWFGHTYKHLQPHLLSERDLRENMMRNVEFAKAHSLPAFTNHYSVSPHHSGAYPIHPPLYTAWRDIWNVSMTTTEEYPHLYPPHLRRGFIHDGTMVVPRQTCRLFTRNVKFDSLSGGRTELLSIAEGGEVFDAILHNPVSVFMTHNGNYGNDRLALVLFKALFEFIQQWTQLELKADRPLNLGRKYFELFPRDKEPLWTSPCDDTRHMDILPPTVPCSPPSLPSVLILGPQKTGTTALYYFLKLHPLIQENYDTKDHYEEVQFFTDMSLYLKGTNWYMNKFPPLKSTSHILFEKSATYFTHPLAPVRAHSLLPNAKLIVILGNPAKRAYSWYQHMRAHNDSTAMKYTFAEVIRATPPFGPAPLGDRNLLALRDHCLSPGLYHIHIERWLNFYPSKQLLLVDGDALVSQPAYVLKMIVKALRIKQSIDYDELLQYNKEKGFYCITLRGKDHCLHKGKGRHYPPMPQSDKWFLEHYYTEPNRQLCDLLQSLNRPLPEWLRK